MTVARDTNVNIGLISYERSRVRVDVCTSWPTCPQVTRAYIHREARTSSFRGKKILAALASQLLRRTMGLAFVRTVPLVSVLRESQERPLPRARIPRSLSVCFFEKRLLPHLLPGSSSE